jgi:hypothetical protein
MGTITAITPESKPLTCTTALDQAYALALAKLPESSHTRLAKAVELVRSGQVFETDLGHWDVSSQSEAGVVHHLNGAACDCEWQQFHPDDRCSHSLAVLLQRKTLQLLQAPPAEPVSVALGPEPAPAPGPEPAATEPVQGIDPKFIVWIQNRPFVRHAGLLKRAHECGLQSLTVEWTHNSDDLSLAHATAIFADGRRFEECADSTKENVGKKVAPAWRRMSLTRASARALRLALGCDLVAVEELMEND